MINARSLSQILPILNLAGNGKCAKIEICTQMYDRETGAQQFRECLHEKTRTGASFLPGLLFDLVSRLHDVWVISYLVM